MVEVMYHTRCFRLEKVKPDFGFVLAAILKITLKWRLTAKMTFNTFFNALVEFGTPKNGIKHVPYFKLTYLKKKTIYEIISIWRPSWK